MQKPNVCTSRKFAILVVFTFAPSKQKNKTVQQTKCRIWDMKGGNVQRSSPRFRTVQFFYARYSEKLICPNLQSFVWRRHVGAYPDGQPTQRPETDRNINLILAVRFRATFLKTVRLSKQVLRESGSDRNFGYIQSLSTVCSRPLSYTHTHTHTHIQHTYTHTHTHTSVFPKWLP